MLGWSKKKEYVRKESKRNNPISVDNFALSSWHRRAVFPRNGYKIIYGTRIPCVILYYRKTTRLKMIKLAGCYLALRQIASSLNHNNHDVHIKMI